MATDTLAHMCMKWSIQRYTNACLSLLQEDLDSRLISFPWIVTHHLARVKTLAG